MAATKPSSVVEVDFTGVESGGGRVHVPEGDYALKIAKTALKKGQDSGNPFIEITFEISKGDQSKKKLFDNFSLTKQSLWKLRGLLEACGKQVPQKAVKLDLHKMISWECAGAAADEEYEGKKKSSLVAHFPLAELNEKPKKDTELEAEGTEETGTEETEEL